MPEISAIVPTRNRADLLPMVLDALRTQSLARSRFEVIIVDDGSTDNTQEVLKKLADHLPLRVFRQNHAGIAAAKNLGIFASRSPVLLFLDDDDVADQDLLAAHFTTHRRYPAPSVAVLGYTDLAGDIASSPLMHHVTQVGCQLFSYDWMTSGMMLDYTCFWGGRSSCKRSLLVEHGIFNPNFTFGCEDIELGWRLKCAGLSVVYEPAAKSTMIRRLTFHDFCNRQRRQGRAQRRFAQLHPNSEVRTYCEIELRPRYLGRARRALGCLPPVGGAPGSRRYREISGGAGVGRQLSCGVEQGIPYVFCVVPGTRDRVRSRTVVIRAGMLASPRRAK